MRLLRWCWLVAMMAACGRGNIATPPDANSFEPDALVEEQDLDPDGGDLALPDDEPQLTYGIEFFVAPIDQGGDDSNPGTQDQPFASLERARQAVREVKGTAGLPDWGVGVWIRGGLYERQTTFELSGEDSGEDGKPVVYRGYPGEEARLVGGTRLEAAWFNLVQDTDPVWDRLDPAARGNLHKADLGAQGITSYGTLTERGFGRSAVAALELFFNRESMELARWPDRADGFATIATALSDTQLTYSEDRPAGWAGAEEVWLHGYWKHSWADLHVRPTAIDTTAKIISFATPPGYGIAAGQPFYAENLLEEITAPGEWFLSRSAGVLYFWPPGDLGAGEILVSTLEGPLVRLQGASEIRFEDLTFEVGREKLVVIEGGTNNAVLKCKLLNAGTDAALIRGEGHRVERCEITGTGDAGILVLGGDRRSLEPANNVVQNNHIHHWQRWSWTYKGAIQLNGGDGNVCAHNLIHDAPHTAIFFSGNNHRIEYNEIHDVCRFSADAGAIYAGRDWGWRGNQIRFNFIHHITSSFPGYALNGIYLDDCLSGIQVFGNVLYQIQGNGILNGGGRDNRIENNLIARCGAGLLGDNRGLPWIKCAPADCVDCDRQWDFLWKLNVRDQIAYQQAPWSTAYPALAAIPNDCGQILDDNQQWRAPEGCVFSRNIGFANGNWMDESSWVAGTAVFSHYQEIADNLADQDPLFEDEAALDLSLRPDSPAFTLPGFVAIPFRDIGIEPEP